MPKPKQRQVISDFSGGLVTFPSPLDMRENQFQTLQEVDNMKLGRLEKVKGPADDSAVYTNDTLKGQGLFTYRTEWDKSGTPAENSTNWFILYRKNGDNDRTLIRYDAADGTGGSWAEIFDETVWTSKTSDPLVDMYAHNEVLRVSDGNFANTNNNSQWYGYIKRSRFGNTTTYDEPEKFKKPSSADTLSEWVREATQLTAPVITALNRAWDYSNRVDNNPAEIGLYIHYPDAADTFMDDVGENTFKDGDSYTATFVYDYIQESSLGKRSNGQIGVKPTEVVTGSGARVPGIQVIARTDGFGKRVTGINVYWNPEGDVDWYLLISLDIEKGWQDDYKAIKITPPYGFFVSAS